MRPVVCITDFQSLFRTNIIKTLSHIDMNEHLLRKFNLNYCEFENRGKQENGTRQLFPSNCSICMI